MEQNLWDLQIGELSCRWSEQQMLLTKYKMTCESTNSWAKADAFQPEVKEQALVVYLSDNQTTGRGRGNNTWVNPKPGTSLLSTWSFDLARPLPPLMTVRFGMALIKAANSSWPFLSFSLKAPNDLYLGNKKLAGLLIETISQGEEHRLLIGLGLNVTAAPSSVSTSTSILDGLSSPNLLLTEDYIGFLDRWVFELTEVLGRSSDQLSPSECLSIQNYLNAFPEWKDQISKVEPDGSFWRNKQKTNWFEL